MLERRSRSARVSRRYDPATKISEPGVYQMSLEQYHSSCCVGPSVSSSGLRTIENRSLAHFWAGSYLNPEREPFTQTASLILGSAAHHLLLGESGFAELFVLRPSEAPDGRAWNGNNLSCKKWLADQAVAGKTIITEDQIAKIRGMARSLGKHPLIRDGLMNGMIEQSLIVQDPETGLWVKSRPDALPNVKSGDMIADLKTTADASGNECDRTITTYGYHQQLALTGTCMEWLFGTRPDDDSYVLIFVEPEAPHAVSVRPVDPEAIRYGRMQNRRALRKLAEAIERNDFPAYENDTTTVSLTDWMTKRLERDVKYGLLLEDS